MKYLQPFALLKERLRLVSVRGQLKVDITYDDFLDVVRGLLEAVPVDEDWYRQRYPDVGEAIEAGSYQNGRHHFVMHGYFEGRQPFDVQVDETWYLAQYPDVKAGIEDGRFESAQAHYAIHGYAEGRKPGGM